MKNILFESVPTDRQTMPGISKKYFVQQNSQIRSNIVIKVSSKAFLLTEKCGWVLKDSFLPTVFPLTDIYASGLAF